MSINTLRKGDDDDDDDNNNNDYDGDYDDDDNNNNDTAHVQCKNKGDTGNNRGEWDYFKVIQKILFQSHSENT